VTVAPEQGMSIVSAAMVQVEWSKSAIAYRMWPGFSRTTHTAEEEIENQSVTVTL